VKLMSAPAAHDGPETGCEYLSLQQYEYLQIPPGHCGSLNSRSVQRNRLASEKRSQLGESRVMSGPIKNARARAVS
jgi:hypothetical protein